MAVGDAGGHFMLISVIARSEATKQSILAARWIVSRSLSSGAHSRDPVARNDKQVLGYAAFLFSARLASWRRISVVPIRRSSGVSHSWKNTTFMSGRTLA